MALVSDTPAFVKEIESDITGFAEVSWLVELILHHFSSIMEIEYVFLDILESWIFILPLFSGTLF